MVNDLTTGSVRRQLLSFTYPFILSNLLQVLYNLVDMVVIGKFVGSAGLSAVSTGGELLNLCTHLLTGFSAAGQIMIAQAVGLGDRARVNRVISTMFSSMMLFTVALSIAAVCSVDWLLSVVNTPAEALSEARAYSLVCFFGLIFICGYNIVSSALRGMGDSKRPLMFIAVAAVLNLMLDLVFIAGMRLGAFGAALATVIGQTLSFVISVAYLYRRREAFGFDFGRNSLRIYRETLIPMLKLGLPCAIQHTAVSASMLFVGAWTNSYGLVASAVTGVGNKLRNVMSIFSISVNTASSAMIGQNVGAGKPERVREIVRIALTITLSSCAVLSLLMLALPREIFGVFSDDPAVIAWAPQHLRILAVCFLSQALLAPYQSVINGIGHASLNFAVSMLDGVVIRAGLSLLLGVTFGMGVTGFWLGMALAGFGIAIPAALYYYSGRWERRHLIGAK